MAMMKSGQDRHDKSGVTAMRHHPLSELIPPMGENDYAGLVADIKAHGVDVPVVVYQGQILDGRHRVAACRELGLPIPSRVFNGNEAEARALVFTLNAKRRHMTTQQKRDAATAELKRDPAQSDRAIAEKTNIDHKTVSAIRELAENGGEIPHHEKRIGTDGIAQSAKKGSAPKADAGPKRGSKEFTAERVAKLKELFAKGMSKRQIATELGITYEGVAHFMKTHSVAAPEWSTRGRDTINGRRIVIEAVNVLGGIAHGMQLIKTAPTTLSREDAAALLDDVKAGQRAVNRLVAIIRERAI